MRAGDDHERQRDRQALIRHVGVEQHARQRQICRSAHGQQHPAERMEPQGPVAHGKQRADGDDGR